MPDAGYNQFCPIAKASEILEPRWTMLILSEIWAGSVRFNDIARGVPGLSPTLLSRRLKELQAHGMITREDQAGNGQGSYHPTLMSRQLQPIVQALGRWAHEHIDCEVSLQSLNGRLLMWNMRRKIDLTIFPDRRSVVQFIFPEQQPLEQNYWLIARPGAEVDLCVTDPGFDVDLFVETDLRTLTAVYMGYASLSASIRRGDIFLSGDAVLSASINQWLRLSSFAGAQAAE